MKNVVRIILYKIIFDINQIFFYKYKICVNESIEKNNIGFDLNIIINSI